MRKDIIMEDVRDVAIAISPGKQDDGEDIWVVYFLNMKNVPLESVLINAEGKGEVDGEERKTATMRFYIEKIEPQAWRKLEILMPEAFVLNNQYWVSFYQNQAIFDKKYIFAANTISRENMVQLPLIDQPGIILF